MNLQLLNKRVEADSNSIIQPGKFLTKEQIDKDKYLTSAYYLHNQEIRLLTPTHLIADKIGDKEYPRIQRNVDIPDFAYDMVLEYGLVLIFIQKLADYAILKPLKEKRFLTIGDHRQLPFGLSNFIQPKANQLGITEPFTYGKPILIVEGLRDCLDAQSVYPYTIATQTAGLPQMVQEILQTLTRTLILAFDNDESGLKATNKLLRYDTFFNKLQFQYPTSIKDFGSLSELYPTYEYDSFLTYSILQLQVLSQT